MLYCTGKSALPLMFTVMKQCAYHCLLCHRLLVARELPISLENMTLDEAVNLALPMLQMLGNDVEDSVRESFVVELDKIIMYYYRVGFLHQCNTRACIILINNSVTFTSFRMPPLSSMTRIPSHKRLLNVA